MNTPSPLVPQGTFPDNRGRSHIRIAVFTILAVHIVLLGALLMAGCKKTTEESSELKGTASTYSNLPPVDTNPPTPFSVPSNPPTAALTSAPNTTLNVPTPSELPGTTTLSEHVVVKGDSF